VGGFCGIGRVPAGRPDLIVRALEVLRSSQAVCWQAISLFSLQFSGGWFIITGSFGRVCHAHRLRRTKRRRFRGSRGSIQRFNSTSRGSTMYAVVKTGGKQYKVAAGEN
jgi:hypothetical protein